MIAVCSEVEDTSAYTHRLLVRPEGVYCADAVKWKYYRSFGIDISVLVNENYLLLISSRILI